MTETDHGKGKIKHNHVAALVRSKIFKNKVERDKTKFKRHQKHKRREFYERDQ